MDYKGVKFEIEKISETIPTDERLKELKYWCNLFAEYDFAPLYDGGSGGNLSFRLKQEDEPFIITCSHTSLADLTEKNFATVDTCDFLKRKVYAHSHKEKTPSSESMLHFAIYNNRNDVNAIFHGHYQKILDNAEKLKLPQAGDAPYGSIELVENVLDVLEEHKFIVLKNHGFLSLGKTMEEAGKIILEIHEKLK